MSVYTRPVTLWYILIYSPDFLQQISKRSIDYYDSAEITASTIYIIGIRGMVLHSHIAVLVVLCCYAFS